MNNEITLRTWMVPAIGWIGISFFGFCAVMLFFISEKNIVSAFFIPFILMSIPVILMAYSIKINEQVISAKTLRGIYQIRWEDVEGLTGSD